MNRQVRNYLPGLAVAGLLWLPCFLYPLFEDTALFALIGRLMSEGVMPYRDIAEQKPPGVFFVARWTHTLMGTSPWSTRLVELVFVMASAASAGSIVGRFTGAVGRHAAIIAMGVATSCVLWELPERGQVELYQGALMTLGVAAGVATLHEQKRWAAIAVGAALAGACWFKPQAALFAVVATPILAAAGERSLKSRARTAAWVAAGAALVSVPILLWLWARGGLEPLYDIMVRDNAAYISKREPVTWQRMSRTFGSLGWSQAQRDALVAVMLVGLVWLGAAKADGARRPRVLTALLLSAWLGCALFQFASGGYLFRYHALILAAPIAVLGGLGVATAWTVVRSSLGKRWRSSVRRAVGAASGIAVLWFFAFTGRFVRDTKVFWSDVVFGKTPLVAQWDRYGQEAHYYNYAAQRSAGLMLRQATSPGDTIQVLDRGAVVYLFAERAPATRYVVASVVSDANRPWHRRRFLEQMRASQPKFVLLRTRDSFPWFGLPASNVRVQADAELRQLLSTRYERRGIVAEDFIVFRRRAAGAAP